MMASQMGAVVELPLELPTSLTPSQRAKREFWLVQGGGEVAGADGGWEWGGFGGRCAREVVNWDTWSIRERTVGANGRTSEAFTVAPPEARL